MERNFSTSFDDARAVLSILVDHGHHAMFAGGCVRDRLLKTTPHDYDIASDTRPEEAQRLFESLGYRVVPTGIAHGTITVVTASGPIEVTTLRKDVKTDGRHAVVSYDDASFEDDSARRDFTINAMFEDLNGNIHDFHGGRIDLQNRLLRFVGNPVERIREDYLRILRFFRFWAKLGFHADPAALKAIASEASGLSRISQERITAELWGIISGPNSPDPLMAMEQTGVTALILPEAVKTSHKQSVILRDAANSDQSVRPWIILSLLLGILERPSIDVDEVLKLAKRLRLSDRQAQTLTQIFRGWADCIHVQRDHASALIFAEQIESHDKQNDLISFFGPIWHFLARHENNHEKCGQIGWLIASDQTFQERRRAILPVSGKDVMEIRPELRGKQIGDAVAAARRGFLNGDWQSRKDGLKFLKSLELSIMPTSSQK